MLLLWTYLKITHLLYKLQIASKSIENIDLEIF